MLAPPHCAMRTTAQRPMGFQQAIADAAQDVAKNSALLSGLPPKSATQPLAPNSVPHVTQSHVGLPPRSQSAAPQGLPRTPSGWYDHTHNSAPGLVQWARSPEVGRVACIMHSICVELAAPSHDGPYCCLNQYS
eukprot:1147780-Pelagomonas_calceolata.AAC.1